VFAYLAAFLVQADILISPLSELVRGSHIPTTMRTSSLSLLATIAGTADLALLPYANDLANAMLDLLQIEGARAAAQSRQPPVPSVADANSDSNTSAPYPPTVSMDSQPTAADAKFPPFRRASLHFLGVLVRAYTRRAYASSGASASNGGMPPAYDFPVRRATTTLGYVAATDVDTVVRVMAREVGEDMLALQRALIGL
jgi:hypothetical protein